MAIKMNERKPLNLENIFIILKLNRRFIAFFILGFTLLVIAISFILPKSFASQASILPSQNETKGGALSSFLQNIPGGMFFGGVGGNDQSKLFAEILKSRTVITFIIDTLNLRKYEEFKTLNDDQIIDAVGALYSVEASKTGMLAINSSVSTKFFPNKQEGDKARKLAAQIANQAINGLDMVLRNNSTNSAKYSREYIEKELEAYHLKLDTLEEKMQDFQQKNKLLELDEQTKAIIGQAVSVGSELAKAQIQYDLAKLQFKDNSPVLEMYKQQIESLKSQYSNVQSGGLTNDEEFAFSLRNVPELMRTYSNLFRERKILEQVMLYLETQRHQEAIQERKDYPILQVLDHAYPPEKAYAPSKKMMAILGFVLAIIFSILIVLVRAYIQGEIYLRSEPETN